MVGHQDDQGSHQDGQDHHPVRQDDCKDNLKGHQDDQNGCKILKKATRMVRLLIRVLKIAREGLKKCEIWAFG